MKCVPTTVQELSVYTAYCERTTFVTHRAHQKHDRSPGTSALCLDREAERILDRSRWVAASPNQTQVCTVLAIFRVGFQTQKPTVGPERRSTELDVPIRHRHPGSRVKTLMCNSPSLLAQWTARHMQCRSLAGDAPKILRAAAVWKYICPVKAGRPMLREDVVLNRLQLLGLNESASYFSGRIIALTLKILIKMEEYGG